MDVSVLYFYTFFERAIEYSICHLPLNDELLLNASFDADEFQPEYYFVSRQVPKFIMILYYNNYYVLYICPTFTSLNDLAKMAEEFVQYQLFPRVHVWEDAQVKEKEEQEHYYTSGKNHFHEMNGDVGMAGWK